MTFTRLHIRRSFLALLFVALFLLPYSSLRAQTKTPICGPSPEVTAALQHLYTQKQAPGETNYAFWQSQLAELKALLHRYPNNYFVNSAYLNRMMGPDPSTDGWPSEKGTLQMIGEYKALHEQHPDDAVIDTLYARTLTDRDTPAAIKLLDEALRKMSSFAIPNLDLVRIYTSRNFRDRVEAESHLSAFLSACPDNPEGYLPLRGFGNDDFIRRSVAQFRKLAESQPAKVVGLYPELWGLEFKLHPRSEYPALRKQVAADVARIRALNRQKGPGWWFALAQGYRLLGDQEQLKWAETERGKHVQLPGLSPSRRVLNQWFTAHPRPRPDAPEAKKQAYYREELKQSNQWVKKHPNSLVVWRNRMTAMEALDDLPAAECAATARKILQLDQANAGPLPLYWRTYFELADFLSQKNVEPALEVELARKGLDTAVADWENIPVTDLNATKDDFDYWPNFYWPVEKAELLIYEAEGYKRLKQPRKALAALGKANLQIQALNSDITADPSRQKLHDRNSLYHRCEYLYWQGMARVAQLLGHDTDAMAYYQSALVARFGSDRMPSPGEKDKLADEAHQLWVKLGGTKNGWIAWYGERANALANQPHLEWEVSRQPLPAFRLTDLHGKTWKLADLKGKVVVLNFWATWCYFCRQEFPRLEKLAEQYKNQPDVLFLSMDTDDDPGLVDPFLKQHKLTFPVLPAYAYAADTLKIQFIPQIWIVGPDGTVHLKAVGYDPTGKWVQGMKDAIEKFKSQVVGSTAPTSADKTRSSS